MNVPTVSVKTAIAAIVALARARVHRPVILTGRPGIGKSAGAEQASEQLDALLYVSNPPVEESIDIRGLPYVVGKGDDARAKWLPLGVIEDLQRLSANNNGKLIIWEAADMPQAPPSTQAAYMQVLHKGEVAGHALPPNVLPIITANRAHDAAGAEHGILWTIRDRAASILNAEPEPVEWLEWAAGAGIHPLCIAYNGAKPEDLCSTNRQSLAVDEIDATPRGWERTSDLLHADPPESLLQPLIHGRLGEAVSGRFLAFRQAYHRLPDLDDVAADPMQAPVLEGAQDRYLAAAMIANAAARTQDADRARAYCAYIARYDEEHQALARTIILGRRPDGDLPGLSQLAKS